MKLRTTLLSLAAATAGWGSAATSLGVVSSNGGANPPYTGINVNQFLGADRFYTNGFTGSRAIVANVEGWHIWNGHESLGHVAKYIDDPATPAPNGDFDRHPTYVGMMIGGRLGGSSPGEWQRGIAYGAELWSGSIATQPLGSPFTVSFDFSGQSFQYPYFTSMIGGVGGQTADVINSSWVRQNFRDNGHINGRVLDAMVNQSGKTLVFSAGNTGESANPRVHSPAANFNSITAGALSSDTSPAAYDARAPFSSFGPNDFWNPATQTVTPGVLAAVDLAAPGTNLTSAFYGGATGGNAGGTSTPGNNLYSPDRFGTSFAAPLIAAGAALVVDVGKERYGGGAAVDGRVVKSVLQNSASKTAGWNNAQSAVAGVITTSQALDYGVGAGRLNLSQAFAQYTTGTANVPGSGGGTVEPIGWDSGEVTEGSPVDFAIGAPLQAGTTLTATLNWFLDNSFAPFGDQSLDNLDLEVWRTSGGAADALVARSAGIYNNVEHLHLTLPQTGEYMLRVKWTGEVFDLVTDANVEQFGLAWAAVPVPVEWDVDADGAWSGGANWSGLVPHVPGARATFGATIAQPRVVTTDRPTTVGEVVFDNANGYTIAGPATITLQTFGGGASVSVGAGHHTISAPLELQSSTALNVAAGGRLTVSGPITSAAYGITLTKVGAGLAELSRVRVAALAVNGGELRVLPSGVAEATSIVQSLVIPPGATPGVSAARFDLTDNALVVDYAHGAASPLPTIEALVREGYGSGAWDGNGIATSMGTGDQFGLGYGEASELATVPPIFAGADGTAVLVRFTRYGDANLDAQVNLDDFNRLAANFGSTGAVWAQGDFTYDAIVNLNDFNRLASNFGLGAGPDGVVDPRDWAMLAAAVPEPGPAGPIGLLLWRALPRRRVRRRVRCGISFGPALARG